MPLGRHGWAQRHPASAGKHQGPHPSHPPDPHQPPGNHRLVHIHDVAPTKRPRTYQPWLSPDTVRLPPERPGAVSPSPGRRQPDPPLHEPRFLHWDFHPGNALFTSPADLDVAHCSTALALLHGPEAGLAFRARYEAQGGHGLATGEAHLYWRLLDALPYAADATKLARPWHESGRTDLTPALLNTRMTAYVRALMTTYA
ncbi:hypothetical protein IAG44_29100 [Streptomyces roseirectus]|uniref:Aminoglycoside phosphotransferase domain-containing protein n=1 Tax=Streptomyces roseirectus TaxID=2768066 RepID=A0A7H0IJX4_9ACTN|nr:hypothetical protein IAG44_29100 [Streptomyces roseirectus]